MKYTDTLLLSFQKLLNARYIILANSNRNSI